MLLLGGTGEGRVIASRLAGSADLEVVTSLAGRVRDPRWPEGEVRIGGFGGAEGLSEWLSANDIRAVLDATHPFAARITQNAFEACLANSVPYAMYRRPPWREQPGDTWLPARDLDHAAELVPTVGSRVFLTIGRQGVSAFDRVKSVSFLVRSIDPPSGTWPPHAQLLLARGPFDIEAEVDLMRTHSIDVVITKNSGGEQTYAKIAAARQLSIPVIVVERPPIPATVPAFDTEAEAMDWLTAFGRGTAL
ncbi:cobalt-precorrin-6A reductase [Rhodococcus sp. GOMB7]|uniref:cobalt-precorrin-6A reductase n=1 Tax=Rhodococcus sp. GOMB7 TaxID=2839033 RepID=UPI0004A899A7|nr:cobalt-precorrin-6A reductase [Rhodococcus sp. GOMB7]KDQ05203.1 cobalt-precorrin-6X reductase [Rhodococcus qingshengii]MBT9296359.1 cobalt-precorrin-6A reductase [Rhodococcus sp. GOMB7]